MSNNNKFQVIQNQYDVFDGLLIDALNQLNLNIDAEQRMKLLQFLDKLLLWNKAYNLTAIKQPKEALIKHIFDCLSILPHLKQGRLLDIGTGAGLPGIIIAICEPDREVTVLDSNSKKIRFIKQSISELKIINVTPIASRIENFNVDEVNKFNVITSRAFASISDFVIAAAPMLSSGGYLQAMKGMTPDEDELNSLSNDWLIENIALSVPQLNEARHLTNLISRN